MTGKPFSWQNRKLFINAPVLLLTGYCLAHYLQEYLWPVHVDTIHTALEMGCFVIIFALFLLIWEAYQWDKKLNLMVGNLCLATGIFDLLHMYYFPGLHLFPPGYYDLSNRLWIINSSIQALLLLVIMYNPTHRKNPANRWLSLLATIGATIIVFTIIYHFPGLLPNYYKSTDISPFYLGPFLTTMAAYILALVIYWKRHYPIWKDNELILAIFFAITAQICFIAADSQFSLTYIMGHFFKITYYIYIVSGVTRLVLLSPHIKLERLNANLQTILNHLPAGVAMFTASNQVVFMNPLFLQISSACQLDLNNPDFNNFQQNLVYHQQNPNQPLKIFQHELVLLPSGGRMHLVVDISYEQELTQLRLQTQTLLDSIPHPVLILDGKQRVVSHNPQFVEVMALEPQLLEPYSSLTQRITWLVIDQDNPENGFGDHRLTVEVMNGNDQRLTLVVTTSFIKGLQGDLLGYVIVLQDITAMRNQYEIVKQREKLAVLGQMAAGIVHEIKNPLTAIRGFSQLLLRESLEPKTRSYLNTMLEAADDLNRVVSDFLSFASPRAPQFAPISLNQLLTSVLYLIQGNSLMSNIEVQYNPTPDEKPVYADRQQLKQVIMNITENAMEAIGEVERPQLVFSTMVSGNEMQILITDNGPGITAEEQHFLGTPFFTTKDRGTGLGLSICYQIIKEHQGHVEVHSQPGSGTTFVICLPALQTYSSYFTA
ncbi:MAG: MASE3 domain-containing protein [Methylocystaceae bacterium]